MLSRYTKLKFRRHIRRQKRSLEEAGGKADQHFERHMVRRWRNLKEVRRFVIGWLVLAALLFTGVFIQRRDLSAYYQTETPTSGGIFREAIVGELTNLNPIFASSLADRSASKLIFNSLLTYDQEGRLVGDLATDYEISKDKTIYTLNLRDDVLWHDGEQFSADDVLFTYQAIQDANTRSYLFNSWQNVKVQKKDDFTITFALPNRFTPFPHSLTEGGILPSHVLGEVESDQLRGIEFNVNTPIGTGPFIFEEIIELSNQQRLQLSSNESYHLGNPRLDGFTMSVYQEAEAMLKAFNDGELAAIADVPSTERESIENQLDTTWHDLPLTSGVYAFLKNTAGPLRSTQVRQALGHATNQSAILEALDDRFLAVNGPLLTDQLGYDESLVQNDFKPAKARNLLQRAGWTLKKNKTIRSNGKNQLRVNLVAEDSSESAIVAELLQEQWASVGVDLKVQLVNKEDIQLNFVAPHNYQILLLSIAIGQDPDVFAYWHSSQSNPGGFNLSEYSSEKADAALESGRTRHQKGLRTAKYQAFLEEWTKDAPAIGFYQPSFRYVQQDRVRGFEPAKLTSPEDRFNQVHTWEINTELQPKVY